MGAPHVLSSPQSTGRAPGILPYLGAPVSFKRVSGGSLSYKAPRPHAKPRAHSNDEDVTMVNVAPVNHLEDVRGGDKTKYDAGGDQVSSHQPRFW